MTIAEVLTQRGYERGVEEVATQMLKNGVDIAFIAKNTGLSIERIAKLAQRLEE